MGMIIKNVLKVWNDTRNNLFHMHAGDGLAYILIYMVVPIFVTYFSINHLQENDIVSVGFFYFSLMISATGCLYDFYCRRDANVKTRRNTKLLLASVPCVAVWLYSLAEMVGVLISHQCKMRFDYVLYVYLLSLIITLWDFVLCCVRYTIFKGFFAELINKEKSSEAIDEGGNSK